MRFFMMNTLLWIIQVMVALVFMATGVLKVSQPKENLQNQMSWVKDAPALMVKIIGALEILGAFGLILPALTGIAPWLTPLAAVGLTLTMIGAIATHVRLAEYSKLLLPVVLFVLVIFIAYGRFMLAPV